MGPFSAATTSSPRLGGSPAVAPLLPKLRGHFAEFLNHGSPARLGMLYQTTCVGFGYGPRAPSLEAFLGSRGSPTSPHWLGLRPHTSSHPDFPGQPCYTVTPGTTIARAGLPFCVTPSLTNTPTNHNHQHHTRDESRPRPPADHALPRGWYGTRTRGYGNINPLSCRLRLSASP